MAWSDFGRKLFYSQLFERIPVPTSNFAGQTVLITGSNSGLGREAARHILRLGAVKVILAVRNLTKGEAAAEDLLKSTGVTRASVEVWELDLSDHDSVKKLSRRANKLERLDAVILNAGMLTQQWTVVDGMEAQIVVNVINTILLGLLLLPKLRASAKTHHVRGRMTFVTSDAHYVAQVKEANASGSLFDALSNPELAVMEDRFAFITISHYDRQLM
jgi:NAD(P)-dependent dehydrogenase (short-subunit alcohol dehydrogenase family)